jgi:ABC-2 type transport system ATP-binding protein
MDVVDLEGLEVRLSNRIVLKGITGALRGHAIGLLGPNGAGKSTLIHTLLGFHQASKGTARVFGFDARRKSANKLDTCRKMIRSSAT